MMNKTAKSITTILLLSLLATISSCNNNNEIQDKTTNPLLEKWAGAYGGVPPFDKIKVADFKPALETAMNENLEEIDKISTNSLAPDFENTIAALERSGQTLSRVQAMYGIWSSCMSDSLFRTVEKEMEPKLAAFYDKTYQNEKLFKRIETVYNSPDKEKLTPEQQRLTWIYYNNFVRAGAKLDPETKKEIAQINQNLAELFTQFNNHLLADETDKMLILENEKDLAGLPESLINSAASLAVKKGKGKWVIANTRSSIEPFLTYSDNRELREKAWRMFVNRGDNGDSNDNNNIISEILLLRAKRAKLLGYQTHAHWRLENTMAKAPENALELMEKVWGPAVARVHEEVADMQAIADKEKSNIKIEPWDYRYYAEKVRKSKYDLNENEVKEYLQLDKLREGMFWVAGEIFNLSFTPLDSIPVYQSDVRVWEVRNKTTGEHVGLWYFDPFARDGKRSGAWMNAYRDQQKLIGNITTIVSNNSNFLKGNEGDPVLISWTDATTLFHEFGHALHGLSSNVTYPSVSGTSVFRDYVEFPSQLLEHCLSTPEVLQRFAIHYKTGQPIPDNLVEKLNESSAFNQGFETTEAISSAFVDLKLHLAGDQKIDPDAFEKEILGSLGMPKELVMRHRTPQFSHVFSGDGYSAGYYSYLWSDVLTADAYTAFTEAGGPYDKAVAERLVKNVFSVGNTIDPEVGYRQFRGRNPETDALMKKRGFPIKSKKM